MAKIVTFSHKNPLLYLDPLSTVKKIDTAKLNSLSLLSYQSIFGTFSRLQKIMRGNVHSICSSGSRRKPRYTDSIGFQSLYSTDERVLAPLTPQLRTTVAFEKHCRPKPQGFLCH